VILSRTSIRYGVIVPPFTLAGNRFSRRARASFAVYPRVRGPEAKDLSEEMAFLKESLPAGPVRAAEVMS
jgi:hypothetical protein